MSIAEWLREKIKRMFFKTTIRTNVVVKGTPPNNSKEIEDFVESCKKEFAEELKNGTLGDPTQPHTKTFKKTFTYSKVISQEPQIKEESSKSGEIEFKK